MSWQDKLISIGQVALGALLVPTIIDPSAEVPLTTSLPTGLVLLSFVPAFWTKGMRFSAISAGLTGPAWLLIAALRPA